MRATIDRVERVLLRLLESLGDAQTGEQVRLVRIALGQLVAAERRWQHARFWVWVAHRCLDEARACKSAAEQAIETSLDCARSLARISSEAHAAAAAEDWHVWDDVVREVDAARDARAA